jgi:hypothetical protein
VKGLSCCHVNSIGKGSNYQTRTVSKIFVSVVEGRISNFECEIVTAGVPVGLHLGLPLEFIRLVNSLVNKDTNDITRMSVHGNQAHDLHSERAGHRSILHHLNESGQLVDTVLKSSGHGVVGESFLYVIDPTGKGNEEGALGTVHLEPLSSRVG